MKSTRSSWRRLFELTAAGALVLVAMLFLWGPARARWLLQDAKRQLRMGAIAEALESITRAESWSPVEPEAVFLRAACCRYVGQRNAWNGALAEAQRRGAAREQMEYERLLGAIRWGEVDDISAGHFAMLQRSGVEPAEAATVVFHGLAARGEWTEAQRLLDAWERETDPTAQLAYLRGLWWTASGEVLTAANEYQRALERQPLHQLARRSLAVLLEESDRLDEAEQHFRQLQTRALGDERAHTDVARILRKKAQVAESRAALEAINATRLSAETAIEWAQLEYESGNFDDAQRWFEQAKLNRPHTTGTLRTAATAYALAGNFAAARSLFNHISESESRAWRIEELQKRLSIDPNEAPAAAEWQALMSGTAPDNPRQTNTPESTPVSQLYVDQCAACHGAGGMGLGPAARHLYPPPRDFQSGRFRIVSTINRVPSLEDLERVIRNGMPGSSMPAFGHFQDAEIRQLAQDVQQLWRAALREQIVQETHARDEETDPETLAARVAARTQPGKTLAVPQIDGADTGALERGREHYHKFACIHCHGADGTGSWDLSLFDTSGAPAVPRNLVDEPMKGGSEPAAVFARIRLGMPGTPHPALTTASDQEVVDLVLFCLSLRREPQRRLTNYERAQRSHRRTRLAAFADQSPAGEDD